MTSLSWLLLVKNELGDEYQTHPAQDYCLLCVITRIETLQDALPILNRTWTIVFAIVYSKRNSGPSPVAIDII